jgi:hypothetical protein
MNQIILDTPAAKALEFWRRNEHLIVWGAIIASGLTAVALVAVAIKAAPVAMKIALASKHGVAAKAALTAAGVAV